MSNDNTEQTAGLPVQENVSAGTNPKVLMRLPVPLFVVAAYLLLGFLWNLWHPGWLLMFAVPVYYQLASMAATADLRKKLHRFPMAVLCVLAYLMLGFAFNVWHPTWMLFFLIPVYHCMVSAVFKGKGSGS